MIIKGIEFKLYPRTAYDVLISTNGGNNIMLIYAKIVYDSIKQGFGYKFWYKRKFRPVQILKSLTDKEIIRTVRDILLLEGQKESDLVYQNFLLGKSTDEELLDWVKANKKKVELIQTISKQ